MGEIEIVLKDALAPGMTRLEGYRAHGGYRALEKAIAMGPKEVQDEVTRSGLRGRGGAGFPTGRKWSFLPNDGRERWLVCNADEGEPGTFKDRYIIEKKPFMLIEGITIAAFAVGAHNAAIYCRGEFLEGIELLEAAIAEARSAGLLGKNILGSGFDLDLWVYRGAGAYICGEESALLESLEGKRGMPRLKPPFPAVAGVYGLPTVVNNVETLATVVAIIEGGAEWYASMGTERSPGTRVFSISGQVRRPGNHEFELGTPLSELIAAAGGLGEGRTLKAVIPGGGSAPILTPDQSDLPMDFESLAKVGSMAGSGGVIVLDDTTCMVRTSLRLLQFFAHESCGKCTPCREGTEWLRKILVRVETGHGREEDLGLLEDVSNNINGNTLCALGDASVGVLLSTLRAFADEYRAHITGGGCPLAPVASMSAAAAGPA